MQFHPLIHGALTPMSGPIAQTCSQVPNLKGHLQVKLRISTRFYILNGSYGTNKEKNDNFSLNFKIPKMKEREGLLSQHVASAQKTNSRWRYVTRYRKFLFFKLRCKTLPKTSSDFCVNASVSATKMIWFLPFHYHLHLLDECMGDVCYLWWEDLLFRSTTWRLRWLMRPPATSDQSGHKW